jgi:hypothetical protein
MGGRTLRFWGSAAAAAAVFAALLPLLFPFGALGLSRAADGHRVWLLCVFCAGVLALLLGGWALLAGRMVGVREVMEAGGAAQALERRRAAGVGAGWRNAGVWTLAAGGWLLLIYFVLWRVLR